jgi:tetratricopeptide (TPR) repeat protein
MVSNFFHQLPPDSKEEEEKEFKWRLIKDSVYPESEAFKLQHLRIHPAEMTEAHLLPFVPNAADIDQKKDKSLHKIAKMLAEAATIQAISTHLMQHSDWDFMAVYFDAIDHFGHGFMKYHPPQMNGVPDREYELYKDVVNSSYRFHDMMLGRMMDLVDEDTTIVLVSDHGFHSDHLRPNYIPEDLPAGPALEHNPFGIVAAMGPKIKKDERVYGATLIDITPTILHLLDLPVGTDMDGKVLGSIFKTEKEIQTIASWDELDGDFHRHPEHLQENMDSSAEALQQLVDLGYIDKPDDDHEKAMQRSMDEANYNLARVYQHKGDFSKAISLLEELHNGDNQDIRFNLDLFNLYTKLGKFERADVIMDHLKGLDNKAIPNFGILEAINLLNTGKAHKAVHILEQLSQSGSNSILLNSELGKTYLRIRKYPEASEAFAKVLAIDPDNAAAFHGVAVAMLRMERYQEAAENALSSIGLMFHYPAAHYHLGEALYYLDEKEQSLQAFQLCLSMAPNMTKAKNWAQRIAKEKGWSIELPQINTKEKSLKPGTVHLDTESVSHLSTQDEKEIITIVSGLPRSGTSLMMQMLDAGGMPIMSDNVRQADTNNPKGYYELEAVKGLFKDQSWLADAKGKVVKIVAPLLQYLPKDLHYRIIFMDRDIQEIMISQQKMLKKDQDVYRHDIAQQYDNELKKALLWTKSVPSIEILKVPYKALINEPNPLIKQLKEFCPVLDNDEKMQKAIDPSLYHNRK